MQKDRVEREWKKKEPNLSAFLCGECTALCVFLYRIGLSFFLRFGLFAQNHREQRMSQRLDGMRAKAIHFELLETEQSGAK